MNTGRVAQAAIFILSEEQQQPEHQEHDDVHRACSMLVRSPPKVSVEMTRVTASSTICS